MLSNTRMSGGLSIASMRYMVSCEYDEFRNK